MAARDEPRRLRHVWIGVVWAEAALAIASALVFVAVIRELDDFCWVCGEADSAEGADFWSLIALAYCVLGAGFVISAHVSGWRGRRLVGHSLAALGLMLAWVALAAAVDEWVAALLALMLAIALAGVIVLRPPTPDTLHARGVAVLAVLAAGVLVAVIGSGGAALVLVLVALPAIGAADSYAIRGTKIVGR